MSLAGSRNISTKVDLVTPDTQMPSAIAALVAAGYPHCMDTMCNELNFDRIGDHTRGLGLAISRNRYHSVLTAHFRLHNGNYICLCMCSLRFLVVAGSSKLVLLLLMTQT
ncbi:hypothetical protein BDW71DRAFT_204839 [Aspergillus fruticulosus]